MRHPLRAEAGDGGGGALVLPEAPARDRLPWAPAVGGAASRQPPADGVVAAVLPGRIVHRHDHEFRCSVAIQVGDRDPRALVLPEVPVRDGAPGTPGTHHAIGVQRAAPVVALVRAIRRIHHEDDQVKLPVAVDIRDGNVRAGVDPAEPVRDGHPGRPVADLASGIEVPSDAVVARVRRIGHPVDHENNQVQPAVAANVGQSDAGAFVDPWVPAGHCRPRRPGSDRALIIRPPADPEVRGILAGWVVDHENRDVGVAVTVDVSDGDSGSGILVRGPVRDGGKVGVHELMLREN